MAAPLQRAQAMLDIHRFKEAQQAAQEALGENPESLMAHLIIFEASLRLGDAKQALSSANTAIGLAPDDALPYLARARANLNLKKNKQARIDCNQAIQLAPNNAQTFGILAWAHGADGQWKEALEAAEAGLELDPEESNCVNARARALMFLHQGRLAFETIDSALARDPEDAFTQTNAGWAKLQAGDREAALNHFTEALRREPDFEFAREGLIAAMKAKSPIYGALLAYTFFMTSLRASYRLAIVVGAFLAYQLTWATLMDNGYLAIGGVVVSLWISLVLLTWAGDAIFNVLLLLNSQARRILSTSQKWISITVVTTLIVGFSCILTYTNWYFQKNFSPLFWIGVGYLMSCMPLAYAGRVRGKNQTKCLIFYAASIFLITAATVMHFAGIDKEYVHLLRDLAIYSLVAFSWVGPSILQRSN